MRSPALALIVLHLILASTNAQNSNQPVSVKPAWVSAPKQLIDPRNDGVSVDIRAARSERFNTPAPQRVPSADPMNENSHVSVRRYYEHSRLPTYPTNESSAIIVGDLVSSQPFLSSDRTIIYSELVIKSESVLKNTADATDHFTVLQEGGTAQLRSGKIVHTSLPSGSIILDADRRYLLFLQSVSGTKAFSILKGWDLTSEAPAELGYNGHYKVPDISAANAYEPRSESALLEEVKGRLVKN